MKKVVVIFVMALALFTGNQILFSESTAFAYEQSLSQDGINVVIDYKSINSDAGKRISYMNVIVMQSRGHQDGMEAITYKYSTNNNGRNWHYTAYSTDYGSVRDSGTVYQGSYQKRILDDCLTAIYE